ncbi:hypothetical protein [Pseudomonas sp. Y24-6]|uniref:hypothetical protein n=1 Tax=Pseudomonas sp. Y24-6 TaxID=2750013 RepID=UPI001CE05B97|nr:hypothetical protein [Pseudomonas sp. Y24-6]MCA4961921.1 hypothetical protein [Pseudomonas sp. Y24-6]
MATAEKTSNLPEFPCTSCGKLFQRRPGGRSTCKASCKKKRQRAAVAPQATAKEKKIKRRKERLLESAFGYWFIEQAKRAGTVQTYHGIDAAGLHQLHDQHNYRKKRHGWVEAGHGKDMFQLCHVQPLKGRDGSTGLTTSLNLFTGIAELNQQQGNKLVNSWAGASIPASARKRKWSITDDMTRDQVLEKIAAYLGPELDTFLDELANMPQRTARLRLARTVFKHQGDDLYESLDRRYTLAELETLKLEVLQAMDATQNGRVSIKAFIIGNCPTDSQLGVLHDELLRFSDVLPDGQHKDNCRFMLSLVRVLGSYLAQIKDAQGKARNRFLDLPNATWAPLQHLYHERPWRTPASLLAEDLESLLNGVYDAKGKELKPGIIPTAQSALQGLEIDQEYIQNRLAKRLVAQSLAPVVRAPDESSWKACGSNWLDYIDTLYASMEGTWQAFVDAGICTEGQVIAAQERVLWGLEAAVERARQHHRNQLRFTQYGIPFEGYPAYLEFPPVVAEPMSLTA